MKAWPVYTNTNLFFFYKEKKIGKYTAKLTFQCYNFGENSNPLQRNGMPAIPKRSVYLDYSEQNSYELIN